VIELEPLTQHQIADYLTRSELNFLVTRGILHEDSDFQDLVNTPLMLNLLLSTYQDISIETLLTLKTKDSRRQYLFDIYIHAMFKRRNPEPIYSPIDVCYWLKWLAEQMLQHAQTVFLIEQIQSTWLPPQIVWQLYIILGIIGALVGILLGWQQEGTIIAITIGFVAGGVFGIITAAQNIQPVEVLRWSWSRARKSVIVSILYSGEF
jgi:hypothetical protein